MRDEDIHGARRVPDWKAEVRERLGALRLDPAREEEIVEEMAQHLDDRYRELTSRGTAPDAASRALLADVRAPGGLASALAGVVGPGARDAVPLGGGGGRRGAGGALWQDLRYAVRALRRSPAFTTVSVLTTALGIGAATAIFSVVNGLLLRPLPYREPDRLVTFSLTAPEKGLPVVDLPHGLFAYYHTHSRVFESMAAHASAGFNLTQSGEPERIEGTNVTADFFRVLGHQPFRGRTFTPREDTPGNNLVTILSWSLWQRRFGGDSSIVGRPIILNDIPTTVVGIMPEGFDFPNRTELWIPVGLDPQRTNSWYLDAIGRLRPGYSADDARREIARLTDDYGMQHRDVFPDAKPGGSRAIATPLVRTIVGDTRAPLLVLLGAVGVVLLIACANVANLSLARAVARGREMAVRCCLGADTRRIAMQFLTESLVLAVIGGVTALALASVAIGLARRLPPGLIPRIEDVRLDPTVFAFAMGVALLAGLLVGVVPALRGSRVDLQSALKEGARGSTAGANRRINDTFVVSQFALSLVLLVGAGLLLRSFQRVVAVDPGFQPDDVLIARLSLPGRKYDAGQARRFYDQLNERVRALPGVRAAGLAQRVPLTRGNPQNNVNIEGYAARPGEPVMVANVRNITASYFEAIGTPILRGRAFDDRDVDGAPQVAIVDETLARRYWPGQDPLGKRLRYCPNADRCPWMTVVGVAASAKHNSLEETPAFWVYQPHTQAPSWSMYLVVRTAAAPEAISTAVRREVAALDPQLPLYEVKTMRDLVDHSLGTRRLTNVLLAAFAATAVLLAAVGIYGVMALNVGARIREFGVRLALGARTGDVLGMVLRRGLVLALAGIIAGLIGAAWVTRFLRGLLFGVDPFDPLTFGAVAAVLTGVALAACLIPARRATKADPIMALRAE